MGGGLVEVCHGCCPGPHSHPPDQHHRCGVGIDGRHRWAEVGLAVSSGLGP